ncbi:MAG: TRAP transporter small permease subunit [Pseudomonadota bacterium]|nr:TRAP transporter small permease subunit [Pseudomonadota bacterium]
MDNLAAHARALAGRIDRVNHLIGHGAMWLSIAMVLVQFIVVVMRYAFGIGSSLMQEAIVYMHAVLFMMAAADTLLAEAHVRVDIFYARLPAARKAMVDLLGNALLVLPFCVLLFLVSIDYVRLSWSVLEGSRETSGIPAVFLLKSVILVFAVQLALQAVSGMIKAAHRLQDQEASAS